MSTEVSSSKEPRRSGPPRKIKNLVINPAYQLRYIFWLSFSGIILIALNAGIFYYYIRENYALLVDLSPMTDEAKMQLYSELNSILLKLMLSSGVFIAVLSIIGLIYSHRTAGPLYHFRRVFDAIAGGKTDARVRLRPKDDFQEVAASFNKMMDILTRK